MLTQLIDLLHKLALDPTPKEIGEMLWLADYLDAPNRETLDATDASKLNNRPRLDHAWQTSLTPKHSESESAPEIRSSVEQPTVAEEPQAKLYSGQVQEEAAPGGIKGIDFRSPGVPALPNALELARALRPFKRTTLSRTKHIFDEKASIDAAADAGNPIPVLRPAPSRWLDIVLVVDESPSMVIWRATIQELQRLLERQGAFRNAQLWRLQYESERSDPRLQIGAGNGHEQRAHRASELIDPSGQRLILIVTDCVSPAWERTGIATLIKTWGTSGPVAIVQMLPKYLWSGTALGDMPEVHLRAKLPGLPNVQLDIKWLFDDYDDVLRRWLQSQENRTAGMVVPVVTLEPRTLASWSTALATGNSAWITGFFFPITPLPQLTEDEFDTETDLTEAAFDARSLVENFNRTASPTARKLARYLAAAPLTLPVMRLVQGAMLPDSLQVHLAEVFLSGLIERQTPEIADIALDEVQYKFVNGVQEVLLASSRISTAIEVLSLVSDYIGERIGQPLDFRAWLAATTEERNYVPLSGERYFATIATKVLSHIGAEYGVGASQIDTQLKKPLNTSSYNTEIGGAGGGHRGPRQESAIKIEGSTTHDDVALMGIKVGSHLPDHVSITKLPNVTAGGNISIAYGDEVRPLIELYLTQILDHYQFLDLKGMGMNDRVALQLPLLEMYVPLRARRELPSGETTARTLRLAGRQVTAEEAAEMGERLSEPVDLLDLLQAHNGVIVLGDPGAGKTTFLKYLALLLALDRGDRVALAGYLPILIPLSAYANALATSDVALQEFLGDYYTGLGIALPIRELLAAFLAQGRTLLLMDGLDEVQSLTQRTTLVKRLEAFFAHHHKAGNKFVLTSRIVGYRESRPSVDGLVECTLVDFEQTEIEQFVHKWSHALERAVQGDNRLAQQQAQQEGRELLAAIGRNPGVRQLAANPLLLTILALMKRQGVTLPERRAQLYETYVKTLLRTWNLARSLDGRPQREVNDTETLRVLAPLALWMHESSPGVGLVKREKMRRKLIDIYAGRGAADPEAATERFLTDVHRYASLLLERGPGEYGFIHLAFQEYLAGVAVVQSGPLQVEPIVKKLAANLGQESWREVTLLAIGYLGLIQQREDAADAVVLQLLARPEGPPGAAVVLAGEAVRDVQPDGVTAGCKAQVLTRLRAAMIDAALPPSTRLQAGLIASDLGDRPADLDELISIGAEEQLGYPFKIGKYPVTNHQYRRFIEEGGYGNERWWSKEGLRRKQEDDWIEPRYWYSEKYGRATQPAVGVSWYEAEAYCKWLTARWQGAGVIGQQGRVRLPTQEEWMAAARGGRPTPANEVPDYPWRGPFDPAFANTEEINLQQTSPVHLYPQGVTADGVWDMAGNVWEWCSTKWRDNYQDYTTRVDDALAGDARRVVRGGSYHDSHQHMRCASRSGRGSGQQFSDVGFRIVAVSHDISSTNVIQEEGKAGKKSLVSHHSSLVREIPTLPSDQAKQRLAELLSQPHSTEEQQLIQELLLALDTSVVQNSLTTALQMSDEGRHNATDLFTNAADMRIWQRLQEAIAADPTINLHGELYDLFAKNANNHPFLLERHAQHFVRAIEPTRAEQTAALATVNELHEKLTKINALEKAYFRTEPFGSQVRNTAIRPLSDIDALVIFRINPQLEEPDAAHQILEEVLRQIYRKQTIINRAATGKFKPRGSSFGASFLIQLPHIWLEAIPAVYARDETKRILVPDRHLRRWVSTNHEIHAQHAQQQDVQTEGIYSNLIKSVKWWHYRKSPWRRFLTGFMLECLIADNLDILDTSLLGSFGRLMQRIQERYRSVGSMSRFPEPGVSKGFKYTSLEPSEFKRFVNLVDVTVEQIQAISPSDSLVEKIESWQQVFGTEFPTTIVSDTDGKE
jgi:formylglycine-generating enzyme required for sulfatase activity